MPAHQENRLEHFLFGRINEAIIRRMPCSILLVRQEAVHLSGDRPARADHVQRHTFFFP